MGKVGKLAVPWGGTKKIGEWIQPVKNKRDEFVEWACSKGGLFSERAFLTAYADPGGSSPDKDCLMRQILGWSEDKYRKDKVARGGYNWRKEFRKRIEEAEWTPHGYKHKKAKTVEEAKEKSMKGKRPPAQYLPGIDNEKLEREALRKAEYIYVDKDKNVVYFFYDTRRPVGYDGGDETTWICAELRKDENTPVLHGHPISVKRLENEYLKDKNKKSWFLRRRMGE